MSHIRTSKYSGQDVVSDSQAVHDATIRHYKSQVINKIPDKNIQKQAKYTNTCAK